MTQRDAFFNRLYEIARDDRDVVLVTADCGAPSLDQWRLDIPSQIYNCGICEQNMIGLAAGLALEGKKPYCYAIAPFATLRCLEQVKVNLCCIPRPVTIVGVGAGWSYELSGPTHHATEDLGVMRMLPNLCIWNPADNAMAAALADATYNLPGPAYVRLDRKQLPDLYHEAATFIEEGFGCVLPKELPKEDGLPMLLVATGNMVHTANQIASKLQGAAVIDLFQIKPVPARFIQLMRDCQVKEVVTIEEHMDCGGIGTILAEIKADHDLSWKLVRIGIPDLYSFHYGGREVMQMKHRIDAASILERLQS